MGVASSVRSFVRAQPQQYPESCPDVAPEKVTLPTDQAENYPTYFRRKQLFKKIKEPFRISLDGSGVKVGGDGYYRSYAVTS